MKKIEKLVLWILLNLAFLAGIIYSEIKLISWIGTVSGAFFSMVFACLVKSIQDLADSQNWQSSLRKYLRGKIIKPTDQIRISFAYLFRIKVDGKYLLVRNGRNFDKFQPVGGVYKCNEEEKKILSTAKFCVSDDNGIEIDESSKNDYRMRVPVKYLRRFVKHFIKTEGRENFNDLSREFIEELIKPGILSKDKFNEITYRIAGRHYSDIQYSKYFSIYELLIADIVDLCLTNEQEEELRKLKDTQENNLVLFATEDSIKACGVEKGTGKQKETITDHSYKILTETTQYLTQRDIPTKDFKVTLNKI